MRSLDAWSSDFDWSLWLVVMLVWSILVDIIADFTMYLIYTLYERGGDHTTFVDVLCGIPSGA